MAGRLILVRHGAPEIDPGVASTEWPLSPAGRDAARRMAERLRAFDAVAIVSSPERKARETAEVLAQACSCRVSVHAALREHERKTVAHLDAATFTRSIENLFAEPETLVFGEETAAQASTRFRTGISEILSDHPDGTMMAVSHGTVMALFLAELTGASALELWRSMTLPCGFVLSGSPVAVLEGPITVP